jgi:HEAT repeat protein
MLIVGLVMLMVSAAAADEEDDLIATLQSAAAVPQKCAACQRLRIVGTARAIPALSALLGDERTSHAARYALEAMPCDDAGAALRAAARTTSGLTQAGLIDSLGWRRDRAAVSQLGPLVAGTDQTVAAAAATALGRIGGDAAVAALSAVRDKSPPAVQPSILEGLLRCAEGMRAEGDESAAATLYRTLVADQFPVHVRVAAWRGLAQADAAGRSERFASALSGADGTLRAAAAQLVREMSDPQVIEACVARWDSLPAESQLAVMDAHRKRGVEALPTVRAATASPHLPVRVAGCQALAELNVPATIPLLAHAAAQGEPAEREAARDALARLHGPGMREALFGEVESLEPPAKVELLRALGERGESGAASVLLQHAAAEAEPVRVAALEALSKLAAEATLGPLLELVGKQPPDADGEPLRRALFAACQASRDKQQATARVLGAMSGAAAAERRQLLTLLNALGTPEALNAAQGAARDENLELAKDAVRVLADWPTAAAAPGLLELAARSDDGTLHALAMRGFVRLAAQESDPAQRIARLRQALTAARRTEEKRQALGQLGQLGAPAALDAVLPYLAEDGLRQEAATAAVSIAERLVESQPELAVEAAAQVLAHNQSADIVRRAAALRGKPKSGPFLRQWLVCGPYRQSGVTGANNLFPIALGPEKPDEDVTWRPVPPADMVDLSGLFPNQTDCVAYLKTWIIALQAADALLLVGSDDGVQAWLNGAVVHANNTDRPAVIDEDTAPIRLNQGPNLLMLKITQGAGGWSACARIVSPEGEPLPGLRCDAAR